MSVDNPRAHQVVFAKERGPAMPAPSPAPLASVLIAIGIVMGIAGWLDIALGYVPPQFGNNEWEFAMISRTFDGMALGTLGISFVAVGAMLRGSRRLLGAMAGVFGVLTLLLMGLALLYLLNVPVALAAAQGQLRPLLRVAIFRTSIFAVSYISLYVWLVWFCWRQFKAHTLPA